MPRANHTLLLELRSEWMYMPEMAQQLLPAVLQLIDGKAIEKREEILLSAFSASGQLVNAIRAVYGENGKLEDPFHDFPENSVAVVPVKGTMLKHGTMCAWGADELTHVLEMAYASPKISAIILDMDSGGGAVSSVPVWINALAKRNKPVLTHADVMCSAAYYAGIHTDHIMLQNDISALVGSIGVMVSWPDYSKALEERGIKMVTVYADQSDHKNKEVQEANAGNYGPLKLNLLNPLAIQFQEAVKTRRPKLNLEVEGIIAGKTFGGKDALSYGLVDSIGTIDAAVNTALELSKVYKNKALAQDFVTQFNSQSNHV